MTRGDLRATASPRHRFERSGKRQLGLFGVPSARDLLRNRAPAIHFHPEAIEAERIRPLYRRIVIFPVPEPIARLACLARRAHPFFCSPGAPGPCRHAPI